MPPPSRTQDDRRSASDPVTGRRLFRQLYDEHHKAVFRFFLRRRFSREESLDLTQETFLRVFQKLHQLRDREKARSWVLRVAANLWKNELRRRDAAKRAADETSLDSDVAAMEALPEQATVLGGSGGVTPQRRALDHERLSIVHREIESMGPQMRRCLVLYTFHGLKYREIADVLQVSIQTVKSHIHQGRGKLKAALDGPGRSS